MKMFNIVGLATVCLSLGLVTGCGDDSGSSSTSGGGGSTGTTSSTSGSGGSGGSGGGGSGPTCNGKGYATEGVDYNVGTITGTIQDLQGKGTQGILSDVCGTNICINGTTNAAGTFNTTVGKTITDVRLIYGGGRKYVQMTALIPDPTGHDFGVINTVALPAVTTGTELAPGGSATSAGVTIDIPADATVKVDALVTVEGERGFRVAVFKPSDGVFPAIPANLNIEGLVATAPRNTAICPGAQLTVPNTFGFAAGAQLEVMYHGTDTFTQYAPYGGWAPVALAEVSGDGGTITLKEGEGIEELGLLGYRLAP